jgi:hypothetical protein
MKNGIPRAGTAAGGPGYADEVPVAGKQKINIAESRALLNDVSVWAGRVVISALSRAGVLAAGPYASGQRRQHPEPDPRSAINAARRRRVDNAGTRLVLRLSGLIPRQVICWSQ